MSPEKFKQRTVPTENGCWEWTLRRDRNGYGRITFRGRTGYSAHRAAYEIFVGPIPAGMTVDHLCFVPACVNPEHLRLLTRSENSRKQRAAEQTHCSNGHEMTPENTYRRTQGGRGCRACNLDAVRRYKQRGKA
jgi:hypothetical protein